MKSTSFVLDVFNRDGQREGTKEVQDVRDYLNSWFTRPSCAGCSVVPVTGALSVYTGKVYSETLAPSAFGYATIQGNDPQHYNGVYFMSSVYGGGHGCAITPETFAQAMVQVAVHKLVAPTWLNDRDQFQVPLCDRETYKENQEPGNTGLPADFVTACVVYSLFHNANNSSAWEPEYQGKKHRIDNQFFPFNPQDVAKWTGFDLALNQQARRARPTFVATWLESRSIPARAQAVLDAARDVYAAFYAELPNLMRAKFHLGAWNPGYYQIRMSLKEAGLRQDLVDALKARHKELAEELLPLVYEYGFLNR